MSWNENPLASWILPSTFALAMSALGWGAGAAPPQGQAAGELDRAGLQAAYERALHVARPTSSGYAARNPGQGLSADFDRRGFTVRPDAGGWSFGLELAQYGWGEWRREPRAPESSSAEGGRIAYAWDELLEEWFVNDRRGLEHGFTVHARPAGASGTLTIVLSVRGELRPAVSAGGRDVHFSRPGGLTLLTYSGLTVFDADGRHVEASWEPLGGSLRLSLDDRGCRYPLTIDPLVQHAYLKASNTAFQDFFGAAVAISGDTAVIGAHSEDSDAQGVDGDPHNDLAPTSGAAYVFVREGSGWSQQAYLKSSNSAAGDQVGWSVAIHGDTIVVGAVGEDSDATGVDGDQTTDNALRSGAAYVFVREGTQWTQQAYLKASNTGNLDRFGEAVAVDGDTVVVSAPGEDSGATGVDGDQHNQNGPSSGAAYVFVRAGTTWTQQAYLKASNTGAWDMFGRAVAVSGDTIVVGAPEEDSGATGVDGNQNDNSMTWSGAAYAFTRDGSTWSQSAYLKASNTSVVDEFGCSIDVHGDTLVVGARWEDSDASGVNGDQQNEDAAYSGAAYVFARAGASWAQQAYLKPSNTRPGFQFGQSVGVHGDAIVVGANLESGGVAGVDGDPTDDSAEQAGAAYLFVREAASWSFRSYVKASNPSPYDRFADVLSIADDAFLVGAPHEDSAAIGVDGDQGDDSVPESGAAYVFLLDGTSPFRDFCFGDGSAAPCPCMNTGGSGRGCDNGTGSTGALLRALGSSSVSADTLILRASGAEPHRPGLFVQGDGTTNGGAGLPFGDGLRCVDGTLIELESVKADSTGSFTTTFELAAAGGASPGSTLHYQLWYRSPTSTPCNTTFNTTNGVSVSWTP